MMPNFVVCLGFGCLPCNATCADIGSKAHGDYAVVYNVVLKIYVSFSDDIADSGYTFHDAAADLTMMLLMSMITFTAMM